MVERRKGRPQVSLRGPQDEERKSVTFRVPLDAVAYADAEKEASGRDKTDVWVKALYLDRDLAKKLAPMRAKLVAFAQGEGLKMHEDLPEIIGRLALLGLEEWERRSNSKKK